MKPHTEPDAPTYVCDVSVVRLLNRSNGHTQRWAPFFIISLTYLSTCVKPKFTKLIMCNTQVVVVLLLSAIILGQVTEDELTTERQESFESNCNDNDSQVETLNGLGFRLMSKYAEYHSNNIVMSPLGVTVLLSTALLGSTGSTYDELADILGFSRDILENRKRHENLGGLIKSLSDTSSSKSRFADAVFVGRGSLREKYRSFVGRVYGTEARRVDFADGGAATMAINEWVKSHTDDEIESFLSENLPPWTRLALVNALYFKAQWAKPFNPRFTMKMVFRTPEKDVTTDFMFNAGRFRYVSSKEDDIHMVAIPYKDNITTMYALKPVLATQRSNITTVVKNLNYTKIDKLINRMEDENCVIRFPKMNIVKDLNLEKYIKLEAPSMFNPDKANFALMVDGADVMNNSVVDLISRWQGSKSEELKDYLNKLPNPGIHVDSIIQKVKIKIDEYGTEAAAATAGVLSRTAELFYADSPFLMFIRNEKTKLVTFSAIIFDPTDK